MDPQTVSSQTQLIRVSPGWLQIERLRLIISSLQRHRFGRRSEKLDEAVVQQGVDDLEQSLAEQSAAVEEAVSQLIPPTTGGTHAAPRKEAERNRGALPAGLARAEQVIDIADPTCPCCGGPLHLIGEKKTEMLDYIPEHVRVRVTRRPRYGCRCCAQVIVQAPAPERPISGGMASEALVAQVLVNKYCDHQPLHRQEQIFARQGMRKRHDAHTTRLI